MTEETRRPKRIKPGPRKRTKIGDKPPKYGRKKGPEIPNMVKKSVKPQRWGQKREIVTNERTITKQKRVN